jgi:hypothetical protein
MNCAYNPMKVNMFQCFGVTIDIDRYDTKIVSPPNTNTVMLANTSANLIRSRALASS